MSDHADETSALAIVLPQTLTSTVEGHESAVTEEGNGGSSNETDEPIPPTVKESPKKAREVVKEVLHDLGDAPQ